MLRGRDALSYGETLLHLAELSRKARPLVAAVGIVAGEVSWNGGSQVSWIRGGVR